MPKKQLFCECIQQYNYVGNVIKYGYKYAAVFTNWVNHVWYLTNDDCNLQAITHTLSLIDSDLFQTPLELPTS